MDLQHTGRYANVTSALRSQLHVHVSASMHLGSDLSDLKSRATSLPHPPAADLDSWDRNVVCAPSLLSIIFSWVKDDAQSRSRSLFRSSC